MNHGMMKPSLTWAEVRDSWHGKRTARGFVVQVTTPDWPGLKVCGDGLRVALFGLFGGA